MTNNKENKWLVIRLGGSLIVPELPDAEYLGKLRDLIIERTEKFNERFLIISGGGKTYRHYRDALRVLNSSQEVQDWIGVYCNRFNAELIRLIFGSKAYSEVINFADQLPNTVQESIVICGADVPGHSSNHDAVMFAHKVGAQQILNLSNIDYVYDSDPKVNPSAKKYEQVSWKQYRTFIPTEWESGMNTPFDPNSSREAQELDIDVIFMKGNPINHLKNYLETGTVEGTVISNKFEK